MIDYNKLEIRIVFSKSLEILRKYRSERSLTQAEFADIINVSQQTYSEYESGLRMPDVFTLLDIADYYHVSLDYLFGRCYDED